MELNEFKQACINLEPEIVVQKHLIDGSSFYFDVVKVGDEFEFKKEIASILNVHIRDVVIVGSGKLGFSIKPDADVPDAGLFHFKKFDEIKKSDLDIAIINSNLFDREIQNLFIHTGWYKNNSWKERNEFAKYILKGRFVVRLLPKDFRLSEEVESVQRKYKMNYSRVVNLEVYKSWHFFETYHNNNVRSIKLNLMK